MLKYLIFIIAQIASCAYADVVFDVKPMKEPFYFSSLMSNSGEVYVRTDIRRILIYDAKSEKIVGGICCRKKIDYVYLVGDAGEAIRVIHIVVNRLKNKISSTIFLYDIAANLIQSVTHPGAVGKQSIALSRNGKFFSLLLDESIHVYASEDLSELYSFSIKSFAKVSGMSVSERGGRVAFVSRNEVYVYSNLDARIDSLNLRCCRKKKLLETGFLGPDKESVYSVSEYTRVCLSLASDTVLIDPPGGLRRVLYDHDDNFFLLATGEGVYAYDASTGKSLGSFQVEPFYEMYYGKYERPFLHSEAKYDPLTNILLAPGSVGILYKIKLSRKAAH